MSNFGLPTRLDVETATSEYAHSLAQLLVPHTPEMRSLKQEETDAAKARLNKILDEIYGFNKN